ncbi:MAG: phosphotransferase family protein [Rhodospirillaceae bacterium]|nr:phosphotransferase family protein [Rhodospirillaceae bacterium]
MRTITTDGAARLAAWMGDTLGITGVQVGAHLTGGNANITHIIESDAGRLILRHSPDAKVSAKAGAGIAREYQLLTALNGDAPAPRAVGYCEDTSVIGAPFSLTSFVDGVSISEAMPLGYERNVRNIDAIGEALVDAIAAVHALDWKTRLPETFGRPDNFLRRQIERWLKVRQEDSVRDLPLLRDLGKWLLDNAPSDGAVAIIHCDYHLDNTLFDRAEPKLNAIIDWEMATIGDPMIDLALLLMFWRRDENDALGFRFVQRISNRPDVIAPERLAERWARRTGYSIAKLDYYRVFAFWRLAAIVEGAYALQFRGQVDSAYARGLEQDVPNLLHAAAAVIG